MPNIKMRVSKSNKCSCCGEKRQNSLEIFDICLGETIVTICDLCNEELLSKTLKANCSVNERVKSKNEMAIIRNRSIKKHKLT